MLMLSTVSALPSYARDLDDSADREHEHLRIVYSERMCFFSQRNTDVRQSKLLIQVPGFLAPVTNLEAQQVLGENRGSLQAVCFRLREVRVCSHGLVLREAEIQRSARR